MRTQTWLSADGSQAGAVRTSAAPAPSGSPARRQAPGTGSRPARRRRPRRPAATRPPGYFPALPTRPAAVLPYLSQIQLAQDHAPPGEGASWLANDLGKAMMTLMGQAYLRPAQRAALYELMARTPGFTWSCPACAMPPAAPGVGIEWTYEGGRAVNIFDPATYAYLGVRTWPAAGYHGPGARFSTTGAPSSRSRSSAIPGSCPDARAAGLPGEAAVSPGKPLSPPRPPAARRDQACGSGAPDL